MKERREAAEEEEPGEQVIEESRSGATHMEISRRGRSETNANLSLDLLARKIVVGTGNCRCGDGEIPTRSREIEFAEGRCVWKNPNSQPLRSH